MSGLRQLPSKLSFVPEVLRELKEAGLYKYIRTLESPQGAWLYIEGKRVLNMCSNNYLGLANHPKLREAAIKAIEEYGVGPGAVRTIAGTMKLHIELEKKIAEFKDASDAITLQSGYNANINVIGAILESPEDAVYSDRLNHASIIDGIRLTKATKYIYEHLDTKHLEKLLKETAHKHRRKLIVTDGVFSMDGDIAPLPELVELAEKYEAILMVDDAHGEGVLGPHGKGIAHHFGLEGKVDIEVGTFSKAFGVVGGYAASPYAELIEFIRQKGRPFTFSSAVTPPDVAATIAAVELLQESDELVKKLWDNTRYFQEAIKEMGYDIGKTQTPITPVMIGDETKAHEMSRLLFEEENIFAQAIAYPLVPKGTARIRVMISAVHTREDLDYALEAFERLGKKLGILKKKI